MNDTELIKKHLEHKKRHPFAHKLIKHIIEHSVLVEPVPIRKKIMYVKKDNGLVRPIAKSEWVIKLGLPEYLAIEVENGGFIKGRCLFDPDEKNEFAPYNMMVQVAYFKKDPYVLKEFMSRHLKVPLTFTMNEVRRVDVLAGKINSKFDAIAKKDVYAMLIEGDDDELKELLHLIKYFYSLYPPMLSGEEFEVVELFQEFVRKRNL